MLKKLQNSAEPTAADVEARLHAHATDLVKMLKLRSGQTYEELSQALRDKGLGAESAGQLKAKINRGKFSWVFFLRIAQAFDVKEVIIRDALHVDPSLAALLEVYLESAAYSQTVGKGIGGSPRVRHPLPQIQCVETKV